jgi:hypothetical protein
VSTPAPAPAGESGAEAGAGTPTEELAKVEKPEPPTGLPIYDAAVAACGYDFFGKAKEFDAEVGYLLRLMRGSESDGL